MKKILKKNFLSIEETEELFFNLFIKRLKMAVFKVDKGSVQRRAVNEIKKLITSYNDEFRENRPEESEEFKLAIVASDVNKSIASDCPIFIAKVLAA